MTGQFHGKTVHTLDAKGRISVPARMREKLGESFTMAVLLKNCVCLYDTDVWEQLLDDVAQDTEDDDAWEMARWMAGRSEPVTPDAQGRILLNRLILEQVGLNDTKEALVVGAVNRVEIWNPAWYEADSAAVITEEARKRMKRKGV